MERVEEKSEVFLGIFLEAALFISSAQISPHHFPLIAISFYTLYTDSRDVILTLIESNRLLPFIASYTFSGTNASLCPPLPLALTPFALPLGVEAPEGSAEPATDAAFDCVCEVLAAATASTRVG